MNGVLNTQNLYILFLIVTLVFAFVFLGAIYENWSRIKVFFARLARISRRVPARRNTIKKHTGIYCISTRRHGI